MKRECSEPDCHRAAFGRGLCSAHYQRARYHGELPSIVPVKECEHCGKTFQGRKWNAFYCSSRCNDAARYAREARAAGRRAESCDQCGGALGSTRRDARFCSAKCGQGWRNAQMATARLATKLSQRRLCRGCGGPIAAERTAKALYCSRECRIRSRRHETYGLTKQELDLLLAQHEQCAVCRSGEWGRKGPQVDHDHTTGRLRGVLCSNCNQGLGRFADDPARLRAAAAYLETR